MDFSPCAEELKKIIESNKPTLPADNPYAIKTGEPLNKLQDLIKMKKENDLSHKQKVRKNKKVEKSKGYYEQQELKMSKQKKKEKSKAKNKNNKGKK